MSICLIDKKSAFSKQIAINSEFLNTTILKKIICIELLCQSSELKLYHFDTDQEYKETEIVKSGDTIHYLLFSRKDDRSSVENKKKGIVYPDELEKIIQNSKVIVVKSSNEENIQKSKDHSLWATTFSNQERLKYFFHNSQNVILLFATNRSFEIKGIARMESEPDRMTDKSAWSGVSNIRLGGNFKIKWLRKKPLSLVLVEKALGTIFKDTIIKACDGQELDPISCKKLASLFQTPLEPYYSSENKVMKSLNKSSQKIKYQESLISVPMILPPLPFSQNQLEQTNAKFQQSQTEKKQQNDEKYSSSLSQASRKQKKIKKNHKKSKKHRKHKKNHKKYQSSSDSSESSEISLRLKLSFKRFEKEKQIQKGQKEKKVEKEQKASFMTENLIKLNMIKKDDISIFTSVTNSIKKTLIVTKNKHPLFEVKKLLNINLTFNVLVPCNKYCNHSVFNYPHLEIIIQNQSQKDMGEQVHTESSLMRWKPAFRITILILICSVSTLVRIFSVIRYESIIHEFDPWFNYRATKFLVNHDFKEFWNFFDSESWYPLGRNVGATVYPGLMSTSGFIYIVLHKFAIPVDIRNICVFLAPVFASFSSIAAYLLTTEVTKKHGAGLLAALFIGLVPSYMSRSVAGSYDNEGVAIFALIFSFYVFIKACNTGSILWSVGSALAYFYMVASWGGYSFIINIIPIFVLFTLITHKSDEEEKMSKIITAYNIFYVLGTLLAMQIPFVQFLALTSSEHMASHGVFIIIQVYQLIRFVKQYVPQQKIDQLFRYALIALSIGLGAGFILLLLLGQTKWSGRSMTLLDPTYAKKYIPIVASVSEHQATTWSSYFFDIHFPIFFAPVGLYYIYKNRQHNITFIGIYAVLSVYFASVMIRLLLVFAPAACISAAIGISWLFEVCIDSIKKGFASLMKNKSQEEKKNEKKKKTLSAPISIVVILLIAFLLHIFVCHGTMSGAEAYSSPSVVLSSKYRGQRYIIDDYREAYYWLRMNTKQDAIIMSWWDYGYQITGFSNRTTLVDNNTWNNTHIATVGLGMSSPQNEAYQVCDKLDVDYVLVIYGGMSHYSGDDINKFLWMVRIGGGVYPHIKEEDYVGRYGYRVDNQMLPAMKNSLMYKLSYYRTWDVETSMGKPKGWDTVREVNPGYKNYKLHYFTEAFTSDKWIVRIYKRNKRGNREAIEILKEGEYRKFLQNSELPEKLSTYKYAKKTKSI